ncbi:hypothetical protein COU78_05785, partial [Candidatus Peregrinibacteria bacterium CG10_big_fil_rev_8_21_14_0_10_49_24]
MTGARRTLGITLLMGILFQTAFVGGLPPILAAEKAYAAEGIYKPINYQGKVEDSTGVAVADGQYNMRFKIFAAASGGNALWTETWNSSTSRVTMTGGLFSAALGTQVAMTGSVDFNSDSLFLQVEFDPGNDDTYEETFSPRRRFASVPYAHNADMLDGLHASSFLRNDTDSTASGTITIKNAGVGLKVTGTASGNIVRADTELRSSGSLVVDGTTTLKSYASCSIITTDSAGNLGCGSADVITQTEGDERYVLVQGATMTGGLLISLGGSVSESIESGLGLEIVGTASGRILHAQDLLTSSGGIIVEGTSTLNGAAIFGSTVAIGGVTYTFPTSDGSASGKVLKTDSSGQLSWSTDIDTDTTYSAGQGLALNGTVFVLNGTLTGSSLNFTTISGATVHAQSLLTSSGGLIVEGSVTFAALTGCTIITTDSAGALQCGTDDMQTQTEADARYVNVSGDTMTGTLVINSNGGYSNAALLEVLGTMSGRSLQVTGTGSAPLFFTDITTGRVGIGTTSPGQKLEVNGMVKAGNFQTYIDANTYFHYTQRDTGKIGVLGNGATYFINYDTVNSKVLVGDGAALFGSKFGVAGNVSIGANYSDDAAPTNGLIVEGNVGIGTTSPSEKLEVIGTISGSQLFATDSLRSSGSLIVENSVVFKNLTDCTAFTSDSTGLLSCSTSVLTQDAADDRYVNVSGDTMTGALAIKVLSGTATGNTLVVDTNGLVYDATNKRVGIGTASPSSALDVVGDLEVGDTDFFVDDSTGMVGIGTNTPTVSQTKGLHISGANAGIRLQNSGNGGWAYIEYYNEADEGKYLSGYRDTNQSYYINAGTTFNSAGLVINNSGSVGIGTETPQTRLDVAGGISGTALKITGAATFGSTVSLGGVTYTFPTSDGSASGKVLKTDSSGQLSWSSDIDTDTTYAAGQGLALNGTVFVLNGTLTGSSLNFTTISGATMHAQSLLTSSGGLIVEGTGIIHGNLTSMGTISGANLTVMAGADSYIMGNVGIGTASPTVPLDIAGTNAAIRINRTGGSSYIAFNTSNDDGHRIMADSSGNLQFTSFNSGTEWMRIENGGDVGIGDSTPQTRLDVAGGISGTALKITGAATFDSTVSLGGVTYTFPTSDGTSSGTILATDSAGQLSWTSADGIGALTQAGADARYVMVQGDTMTGGLLINVGGAASASVDTNIALEVVGTISGSHLHAQDLITSSGGLIVEGTGIIHGNLTSMSTISGANLTIMAGGNSYFLGSLGIGTTSPTEKLEIIGTASGRALHAQDLLTSSGVLAVESGAFLHGNVALGDSSGDVITPNGRFNGSLIPTNTNTFDIGSDANRWENLYLSGTSIHMGASGDEGMIGYNATGDFFSIDPDGDGSNDFRLTDIRS